MGCKNIRKIVDSDVPRRVAVSKRNKVVVEKLSDEEKVTLISLVENHPCIWDKSDQEYKNNQLKYATWKSIGESINMSQDRVKSEFKKLVDQFRAKLLAVGGKSGDGYDEEKAAAVQWKFFRSLLFLKDTFKKRQTESNYSQENQDESAVLEDTDETCQDNHTQDSVEIHPLLSDEETAENSNELTFNQELIVLEDSPHTSSEVGNKSTTTVNFIRRPTEGKVTKQSPISWQKQVTNHMDKVVELVKPTEVTSSEKFLNYLGDILSSVPDEKRRKCEKTILKIANAYADNKEDGININQIV